VFLRVKKRKKTGFLRLLDWTWASDRILYLGTHQGLEFLTYCTRRSTGTLRKSLKAWVPPPPPKVVQPQPSPVKLIGDGPLPPPPAATDGLIRHTRPLPAPAHAINGSRRDGRFTAPIPVSTHAVRPPPLATQSSSSEPAEEKVPRRNPNRPKPTEKPDVPVPEELKKWVKIVKMTKMDAALLENRIPAKLIPRIPEIMKLANRPKPNEKSEEKLQARQSDEPKLVTLAELKARAARSSSLFDAIKARPALKPLRETEPREHAEAKLDPVLQAILARGKLQRQSSASADDSSDVQRQSSDVGPVRARPAEPVPQAAARPRHQIPLRQKMNTAFEGMKRRAQLADAEDMRQASQASEWSED